MPNITVRGIPDDTFNEIKMLAKKEHRSLNSQILAGLEDYINSKKSSLQKLKEIRSIRNSIDTKGFNPSPDEIKELIEEGRA